MRRRLLFVLSLGFVCTFAAQANADLGDGLVAHYPFNGNANDESGNGNHGTVCGASLVDDKDGNPESAYGFDGIDDYIDCGVPSYVLTTSGTICGWLRLNRNDAVMNIMTETSGIEKAEWVVNVGSAETGPTGRLGFFISPTGEGGPDWVAVHSDTVLPTSEWLHFTATYDGSKMRVYIDAVEEASLDETRSIYSGGAKLFIGHSDDGYPYYFEGLLDELRVYDRALSASEVCQLHHDPGFENQYEGTCANGIDDDCDTYTDGEDPGCQPPASCVGTAQASTYASNPTYSSSDLAKHVSFFLIPLAAVAAIRIWRMSRP